MKQLKQRVFALILCLALVFTNVGVQNIFNNTFNAVGTTTVDLTGLITGTDATHTCIYKTNYNTSQHWEECIICNTKKNTKSHTYTTTWANGTVSCAKDNSYTKSCTCGYSYTGHRPCVWDGKTYEFNGNQHTHSAICKVCNGQINWQYYIGTYGVGTLYPKDTVANSSLLFGRGNMQGWCYNSSKNKIGCNGGTCALCSGVNTKNKHYLFMDLSTGVIRCTLCSKEFGTASQTISHNSSAPTTVTYNLKLSLTNGATLHNEGSIRNVGTPFSTITNTITSINSAKTEITIKKVGTFKSTYKTSYSGYSTVYLDIGGQPCLAYSTYETIYPDKVKPTINTPTQTIVSTSSSGWATSKKITITGTENYCNNVTVKITDSAGKVVFNGTTNVSSGQYSISCTPQIEADASGKTFTVTVTDACKNTASKTFTVVKTDSKPPTMTNSTDFTSGWSKTKTVKYTVTDTGIGSIGSGAVLIGFNNQTDLKAANYANGVFSRDYIYKGDVYDYVTGAVYIKDSLGNITTQTVKIGKLDNTAPTITATAQTKSNGSTSVKVTANDNKNFGGTVGTKSGSGVTKYAISTSSTAPAASSFGTSNTLTATKSGTYYVYAMDAVGNISSPKSVNVTVQNTLTVNPNGGTWSDSTENQTFTLNQGATKSIAVPTRTGYTFTGWTLSGTGSSIGTSTTSAETFKMGTEDATLTANWTESNLDVTYIDVIDSIPGTELGRTTKSVVYGSTVDGTDIGSSTADNAYYKGYYLVDSTSATLTTSGATVYRIFKLRTIDIEGTVNWIDNSNMYDTRPDSITVSLYRNGTLIDSVNGLTAKKTNEFSFSGLEKYNKSSGEEYIYTVLQDEAISKTAPEDKYISSSDGYNLYNKLENETEIEEGLVVRGSIYWEDNGNSLNKRPETVIINLYKNGEEYNSIEIGNENSYKFTNLPKYDENLEKYVYTVEEVIDGEIYSNAMWYYNNGEKELAYTIEADTPNPLDFTNVLNKPKYTPIPVKPTQNNIVTIKSNIEPYQYVTLKALQTIINDDFSVSYGDYSGVEYNVIFNNVGTVLEHINAGKYDLDISTDASYVLKDIEIDSDLSEYIYLEGEQDTYYLVIKDMPNNIKLSNTVVNFIYSEKDTEHTGYETHDVKYNYWNLPEISESIPKMKMVKMPSKVEVVAEDMERYTITYGNSDTIDEEEYLLNDRVRIKDYVSYNNDNLEFLGWSLYEDSTEIDYLPYDTVIIEDNIILYPVFKELEIIEEVSEEQTETSEENNLEIQ